MAARQDAQITLYVATDGNDAWSGTLKAPNAIGTDGPFATLARVRDAIRALKAKGARSAPVTGRSLKASPTVRIMIYGSIKGE